MTSTHFTSYVESAIERLVPGAHAQISSTFLTWNNVDRSASLSAENVLVKDQNDVVIAEVPHLNTKLGLISLVSGQFLPEELLVDHPQVHLTRKLNGEFYFGSVSTALVGGDDDLKSVLRQIAHNLSHAFVTHKLDVQRAVIIVHDETSNSDWSVSIPEISLGRQGHNLSGLALVEVAQKDTVSSLEIHYSYDRAKGLHNLTTQFADMTPSFFAGGHPGTIGLEPLAIFDLPLTGEIGIAVDNDLKLEVGNAKLHGDKGVLNFAPFWTGPRAVKSLDIAVSYDRLAQKLSVPSAVLDFGVAKLIATMGGKNSGRSAYDLDFETNLRLENWPMDEYGSLWPKPILPHAREWIIENMTKGTFDKGDATFKGSLSWNDLGKLAIWEGYGTISASHGNVKFMDNMPFVEDVNALGAFDLSGMTVAISGGGIGAVRIQPFTIKMNGFDKDDQYIEIPVRLAGPIPEVLKLINAPSLGYAKKLGLAPSDISGDLAGEIGLRFPMLRDVGVDDISIDAKANLTNVASTKLVKDLDIEQGDFSLSLDKDSIAIMGVANLNKVSLQASWQENFTASGDKPLEQAHVGGIVADDQWKVLGFDALSGSRGPTNISLDFVRSRKDLISLTGTIDFTMAEVHLDELNWKKPAGSAAVLKISADMPDGRNIAVTSIDLNGPLATVKGDAVLTKTGRLLVLNLKPFVVGRTNATLRYSRSPDAGGTVNFDARGEALDVSNIKGNNDSEGIDAQPKEFHINVKKLYTSSTGFISDAEGYAIRDPQGWSSVSLRGFADGGHKLDFDLTPQDDGRVLVVTCDDFGKALKSMGFTDTVTEGALTISGSSIPGSPRVIEGTIKVGHFSVKKLPVLMTLLNATSPFGIIGILTNSVDFDHMNGKFRWAGDNIDLMQVSAAGKSVGMTISGRIDMDSGVANLSGNIVPFNILNRAIGAIPVLGDIVTGGNGGGVLAVSYSVNGRLGNPNVSVNPVSLLTPGFLRNLFFDDDMSSFPAGQDASGGDVR